MHTKNGGVVIEQYGLVVVGILGGLLAISEALAQIPALKSNSVLQLAKNILKTAANMLGKFLK